MSTATETKPVIEETAPATPTRKRTPAKSTTTKKAPAKKAATSPRRRGPDNVETRTTKVVRVRKTTLAEIERVGRETRRRGIDAVDHLIDLGLKSMGHPGLPLPGDDEDTQGS